MQLFLPDEGIFVMETIYAGKAEIPDKQYFKIGEASEIAGVKSYVLRFRETEFKGINPKRTSTGQRLYRRVDVELILQIKHLLHEKKFTIQGAKQYLKMNEKTNQKKKPSSINLEEIRTELQSILDLLD